MLCCSDNGTVTIQNRTTSIYGKWLFEENEYGDNAYNLISYNKPWYALDSDSKYYSDDDYVGALLYIYIWLKYTNE